MDSGTEPAPEPIAATTIVDEYPGDEKSPGLAFFLDFLLGFGAGNWYAGSTKWGAVGLTGSVAGWTGLTLYVVGAANPTVKCDAFANCNTTYNGGLIYGGAILASVGGVMSLCSWIAAPINAGMRNDEVKAWRERHQSMAPRLDPYEVAFIEHTPLVLPGGFDPSREALLIPLPAITW